MARELTLPSGREFTLSGDVRLFRRHPPYVLDEALGRPHDGSVTWARQQPSSTAPSTPSAAFDGDPATSGPPSATRPSASGSR